ncbi:GNAT family N-acetyltransferase [bacterium]|nr:GNAT family N-acetyltransferase [candidate division CSSED10-310 bacterium]
MKIRYLTPSDLNDLFKLWAAAELEIRPRGRDSKKSIKQQMKTAPKAFIGCFDENVLIGSVLATHDGRKGWVNRIAVLPAYRRKGIAKMLVDHAEKVLTDQGISIYAALIYSYNTASEKLFESQGYEKIEKINYFRKRRNENI